MALNVDAIRKKLEDKQKRLQQYLDREAEMLSKDGIKSYGIGPRSIARYDTALKDVQDMIQKLEKEIAELEGLLNGKKPRRMVGVVPRDNW